MKGLVALLSHCRNAADSFCCFIDLVKALNISGTCTGISCLATKRVVQPNQTRKEKEETWLGRFVRSMRSWYARLEVVIEAQDLDIPLLFAFQGLLCAGNS